MAAWLLWSFFLCLHNQLSSIHYLSCIKSTEVWKRPFGNLGICISASALALASASALALASASASASAMRKFYFCLTKCFMKSKRFMWNILKYFFLHLVMRHQYPSVTISHFSTISYHISTKIPVKHLWWSPL